MHPRAICFELRVCEVSEGLLTHCKRAHTHSATCIQAPKATGKCQSKLDFLNSLKWIATFRQIPLLIYVSTVESKRLPGAFGRWAIVGRTAHTDFAWWLLAIAVVVVRDDALNGNANLASEHRQWLGKWVKNVDSKSSRKIKLNFPRKNGVLTISDWLNLRAAVRFGISVRGRFVRLSTEFDTKSHSDVCAIEIDALRRWM